MLHPYIYSSNGISVVPIVNCIAIKSQLACIRKKITQSVFRVMQKSSRGQAFAHSARRCDHHDQNSKSEKAHTVFIQIEAAPQIVAALE